jgi:Photoprotection regulator fluorescence recovery protein
MPRPAIRRYSTHLRDVKWTPAEKVIARKAYEKALLQELEDVVRVTKQMAARIKQIDDAWNLEYYLTKRRHEIDREHDYRPSRSLGHSPPQGPHQSARPARPGPRQGRIHPRLRT